MTSLVLNNWAQNGKQFTCRLSGAAQFAKVFVLVYRDKELIFHPWVSDVDSSIYESWQNLWFL